MIVKIKIKPKVFKSKNYIIFTFKRMYTYIYVCIYFFLLLYGHWDHTAKKIYLHLYLSSAATLHGITGWMLLFASFFTQSSRRKRGLPRGLLPTGLSSIVILIIDPILRHAFPAQVNLLFLISFAMFGFWNSSSSFYYDVYAIYLCLCRRMDRRFSVGFSFQILLFCFLLFS
jgi:hypothetical protein